MKKTKWFIGGVVLAGGALAISFTVWQVRTWKVNEQALRLYERGEFLVSTGRNREAVKILKDVLGLNPEMGEVHLMLGCVYDSEGDLEEAEKEFRDALKFKMKEKNQAIAHYNLGMVYFKQTGRLDQAITEFRSAVQTDPKFFDLESDPHLGLSRSYGRKKWYDEAIFEARRSIKMNPKNGKSYFSLGIAYLLKKDIPSAKEVYEDLRIIRGDLAEKLQRAIQRVGRKKTKANTVSDDRDGMLVPPGTMDAKEATLLLVGALKKEGLSLRDFENATNGYYQNPEPERLIRIFTAILYEEKLVKQSVFFAPLIHFFAAVARQDKAFLEKLIRLKEGYSGLQKEAVERVIHQAENFFSPVPKTASDVDFLWAEFFATGDEEPVRKIAGLLAPERGKKDAELLSKVAGWSLIANAQQHEKIREILRKESLSVHGRLGGELRAILEQRNSEGV